MSDSSALQIFTFNENVEIKAFIDANNKYWFVAKEIAIELGYSDTKQAISLTCKQPISVSEFIAHNSKGSTDTTLSKIKELHAQTKLIHEHDVYRLVMSSKLKSAEPFQDWVVEEVLPSIRKTGSYSISQSSPTNDSPITITETRLRDLLEEVVNRTRVVVQFKRHGQIVPYSGYDVETLVDMANEKYSLKANRTDGYDLLVLCNLVYSNNRFMPTKHGIESNILNIAANAFVYADGSTGTTKKVVINQDYADLFIEGLKQHIETKNRIKLTSTSSHVDISRLN